MSASMVLALIVSKILFPGKIFDVIFSLFYSIRNPKESHLHGPRALALDGVVGDADGGRIIAIDWYGGLRVAHFFECHAKYGCLFAVQEEGAEFGLGGGGDNES
jgi:hypothetical protein